MRPYTSALRASATTTLLLLLIVLAPVAFGRWTLDAFAYNKAFLLQMTAVAILAFTDPRRIGSGLANAIRDPAVAGAVLFGLSATASTIVSVSPRTSLSGAPESFAGSGVVAAYLVLFLVARSQLAGAVGPAFVAGAAAIGMAGAGSYAISQVAGADPLDWSDVSRIRGFTRPFSTLGHPDFFGAYLAMALPLLLYLAVMASGRRRYQVVGVWILLTVLATAGVIASLSRAAWLAAGCGVFVFAACLPRRTLRTGLAIGLLVVGIPSVVVLARADLRNGLAARFHALSDGGGRYQIWRTAWLLFRDRPWLGSGLDTFQLVFGSRQSTDYWHAEWGNVPTRAHNEFLHVLATQGLFGASAVLIGAFGLARAGIRAWRRTDIDEKPRIAAVIGSLVAFTIHIQFAFVEPGCGVLAISLAGMLAGSVDIGRSGIAPTLRARTVAAGAAIAFLLFVANVVAGSEAFGARQILALGITGAAMALAAYAFVGTVRPDVPTEATAEIGVIAKSPTLVRAAWIVALVCVAIVGPGMSYLADCACQAGEMAIDTNPAVELQQRRSAVALAPGQAIYWTKLGAAAVRAAARQSSAVDRSKMLHLAVQAADRAVELVPADPANHANRGRALAALRLADGGDAEGAFVEFDEAIARAPCNLVFRADAGQAALQCGRLALAREYLEAGRLRDPSYARFTVELGAVALREGRADEAVAFLEEARALQWYGNPEGYERLLPLLGAAHLAAFHAKKAEYWARAALERNPDSVANHCVLAGALEMEGRNSAAATEYRTVLELAPGWDRARAALRRLDKTVP